MPLRSVFLDFNAFFASVEQQERPELRGKPVGVAPVVAESTCCIAVSYEAKKYGVKTGTQVAEARRLCPGIHIVEGRQELYVRYHQRVVKVVDSVIPVKRVWSIDEMACQLARRDATREAATRVAHCMKRRLAEEEGAYIRSSIGVAPNDFLAKVATGMQKPDGLVILEPKDLPEALYRLRPGDLYGIGSQMEARLEAVGITTMEKLWAAPKGVLRGVWRGVEGERFYERLRGREIPGPEDVQRSMGHSHVLPPQYRNDKDAFSVLGRLLQKAGVRLRQAHCLTDALALQVRYLDRERWNDMTTFLETDDAFELLRHLIALWKRRPRRAAPPSTVGVQLLGLRDITNTSGRLFGEGERRENLNHAIDSLNARFGKHAVHFGAAHECLDSAPLRIAFTRIPDLETEQ